MDTWCKEIINFINVVSDIFIHSIFSIFGILFFLLVSPILYLLSIYSTKKFPNPKNILITGASSGIGRSFAIQYADVGKSLFLTGRCQERLEDVAALCRNKGAIVECSTIDVTEKECLAKWIQDADRKAPIDLVIANAGVTEESTSKSLNYEETAYYVNGTNVEGVMNTVYPLLPAFKKRMSGQVVVTGSMSSEFAFMFPVYSATKCWAHGWCNILRQELSPYGIGVTILIPGFVKTRMIEAMQYSKPLEKTPDESVSIFINDIKNNKAQSSDNPITLYSIQFINKVPPNLRDGWTYLQNRLLFSQSYSIK